MSDTTLRPPGPRGTPSRSTGREYLADPLRYLTKLQREHGDIVYFKLGLQGVYLVSDPELIYDVLVTNDRKFARVAGPIRGYSRIIGEGTLMTSEGDRYRRQRRLVAPALHHRRLLSYADIVTAESIRTIDRWRDGDVREVLTDMESLTLAVVMRSLFGADLDEDVLSRIGEAVKLVLEAFDRRGARYATLDASSTRDVVADLDEIVYAMIDERRRDPDDRGDLLSMLLLAQDEEGDGAGMTDQEVRGEILALIAAGHDTSSAALAWTWYLLAQNPAIEARLHDELERALGGRMPTAEDLPALSYAERVMNESLRLYPPSGLGTDRLVLEECELGGYRIPVGSIVLFSQWVVHRDPRWFPDPDRFEPDRWLESERGDRPRLAFFPFSAGSRACIGSGFASFEITLALATIAQRWRLELGPGQEAEVDARVTLAPRDRLPMIVRSRS